MFIRAFLTKSSLFILVVFLMATSYLPPSLAADWEITPQISADTEYNDNILFERKGQELDDVVFYLRPAIEAKYGTKRFTVETTAGLNIESYADFDELNTVDQDYRLSMSYAFSRTFDTRARGYYRKDTTQETELVEEGLRVDRDDREKYGGGFGFTYKFSSVFNVSTDWIHRWSRYDTLYDDRESDEIKFAPTYIVSPKTKLFLDTSYQETEYDRPGDPSITNYRIRPSIRHDFAKDWYIIAKAGYRHTEDKTQSPKETTDGFDFLVDYHKNWKRAGIDLIASRDQYSTVDETSVERTRFTVRGTYLWSERFSTGIAGTYRFNRPDQGSDDYDYFTVSPSAFYKLTKTVTLKAKVDYSEYNYDENTSRDSDRFRALLTVDLVWPRLWSGS